MAHPLQKTFDTHARAQLALMTSKPIDIKRALRSRKTEVDVRDAMRRVGMPAKLGSPSGSKAGRSDGVFDVWSRHADISVKTRFAGTRPRLTAHVGNLHKQIRIAEKQKAAAITVVYDVPSKNYYVRPRVGGMWLKTMQRTKSLHTAAKFIKTVSEVRRDPYDWRRTKRGALIQISHGNKIYMKKR